MESQSESVSIVNQTKSSDDVNTALNEKILRIRAQQEAARQAGIHCRPDPSKPTNSIDPKQLPGLVPKKK